MSHTTLPTVTESAEEEIVWPEFNPSPAHRRFLERLRSARLERGLSIADMSDEVGLTYRLASEFEHGVTPLPFEWLEVWCQVVGVPFEDFLAIYWADEEAYAAPKERETEQHAPCITNTTSGDQKAPEAPAPAPSRLARGYGWLSPLRFAVAHIRKRFLSLFSASEQKPK